MNVRVVLDTNTWISALLWGGVPQRVLEALSSQQCRLVVTPKILDELADVLGRPKCQRRLKRRRQSVDAVLRHIRSVSWLVPDETCPVHIPADPDDEVIVACAITAQARFIISGDRHLLALGTVNDCTILTPRQFLEQSKQSKP